MARHIRNCAGGVVFLLKNGKGGWVMPKGVIRGRQAARDVALARVEAEAGIRAAIVAPAGHTRYDSYSQSRHRDGSNRIGRSVMRAVDGRHRIAFELGFLDGGYFPYADAVQRLTHGQDREILRAAWEIVSSGTVGKA